MDVLDAVQSFLLDKEAYFVFKTEAEGKGQPLRYGPLAGGAHFRDGMHPFSCLLGQADGSSLVEKRVSTSQGRDRPVEDKVMTNQVATFGKHCLDRLKLNKHSQVCKFALVDPDERTILHPEGRPIGTFVVGVLTSSEQPPSLRLRERLLAVLYAFRQMIQQGGLEALATIAVRADR